jgi:hypothetical protein
MGAAGSRRKMMDFHQTGLRAKPDKGRRMENRFHGWWVGQSILRWPASIVARSPGGAMFVTFT